MIQLVILGAGGHGAVVADAAMTMNRWSDILFLDDDPELGPTVLEQPVAGVLGDWHGLNQEGVEFVVAIGSNALRQEYLDDIIRRHCVLANVIHASAVISPFSELKGGVVVCAGAVINPRVIVDQGAIINTGATIDHDCAIGAAAHISPGANLSGGVTVGDRSWLGTGSSVREGVTIGDDAVVGAGAAVLSDVPAETTVVGVPARPKG
ncbi:MAG: acetyltransferase [Woeseiaceae bacterium]